MQTAPELIVSYDFKAPRERVFAAWMQSEQLRQWFCPTGFTVDLCEVDARVGGSFRVHMRAPDGGLFPSKGEYVEITPPAQLSYRDSWDDNRVPNPPMQVTIALQVTATGTRLDLFTVFESPRHREEVLAQGVPAGWRMFMDNLAHHLAA